MSEELRPPYTGPITTETAQIRAQQAVEYYRKHINPGREGAQNARFDNQSSTNMNGYSSREHQKMMLNNNRPNSASVTHETPENFVRGGHRSTVHGSHSVRPWQQDKRTNVNRNAHSPTDKRGNKKRLSRGLYRSNSNLEESMEYINVENLNTSRREYGSTSSLETGTNNESFFEMLQDLKPINLDQRSPAPAHIHEVLRGRAEEENRRGILETIANGSILVHSTDELDDGTQSPRTKAKFKQKDRKMRAKSITPETSQSLLKRIRGKNESDVVTKAADIVTEGEVRGDERFRRKAFTHYDCQSIGFDINKVLVHKNSSTGFSNIPTGASAASATRNSYAGEVDDPDVIANTDDGDGKSNDLVSACPFFRNEIGGEEERILGLTRMTAHTKRTQKQEITHNRGAISMTRSPVCCGVTILDPSPTNVGHIQAPHVMHKGHVIEYMDQGALYYRHFFKDSEHQHYFGIDESLGPVAVSIKREKLEERENNLGKSEAGLFQYRIIFRTSKISTLRGAILEDAIPASGRLSSSRGVPVKDVLEFLVPELQVSCLRPATAGQKTTDQLLKLDEQRIFTNYKIGVLYCKKGQSTEEEMYSNEHGGPAFEEFLNCIGQKVRLKGFEKYRAQLDNKSDSTGTHSVYTMFNNSEVMFHISTLLPYSNKNKQQLLRKRHIGNDIVTIVFQEPGSLPFSAKTVRSQFQHVFIVVRAHHPCTDKTSYSISVTRSKDVPPFGPAIPENAKFPKSSEFADFLLAKVINGENAAHHSEKFYAMATRTRQEYLKDLATNFVGSGSLESASKLKFGLSGKKKEKNKQKVVPDYYAMGAVVWRVQVEDVGSASPVVCLLGISAETLVIVEESSKDVVFTTHCGAIIGWTSQAISLRLYYNQGECLVLKPISADMEELQEIITRLGAVTPGCETAELTLKRNGLGQLGFHIQAEGIVTDVEQFGFASETGLRKGTRLVEICKVATVTLNHDQMVDLLRTSATVKVVVIPPLVDGGPRGVASLHANHHYSSFAALNAVIQAEYSIHQRGSHLSLSCSSELAQNHNHENKEHSPLEREATPKSQRNSNTLPHQKRSSTSSLSEHRGEMMSPPARTFYVTDSSSSWQSSSLPRSVTANPSYHGYSDSIASSGRGSMFDGRETEHYGSKRGLDDSSYGTLEERHTRSGSRDSTENPYASTRDWERSQQSSSRSHSSHRTTPHPPPQAGAGSSQWVDSVNSGSEFNSSHSTYLTSSESVYTTTSQITRKLTTSSQPPQHPPPPIPPPPSSQSHPHPGSDQYSVQHGNYAQELLKQSQNTKYLLTQGQEGVGVGRVPSGTSANSSSQNLSDTSFSSGSSHATNLTNLTNLTAAQATAVAGGDHSGGGSLSNLVIRDDTALGRRRQNPAVANLIPSQSPSGKGRVQVPGRKGRDTSPLSSENSSPRSSLRNLSGMSSEESLSTRLRPGVTTSRMVKAKGSTNLQEDLMRLIDPDISETDIAGLMTSRSSHRRQSGRLQRTMSDESLHSGKSGLTPGLEAELREVLFPGRQNQEIGRSNNEAFTHRISPRATADTPTRNRPSPANQTVPVPDSTASLDWSSLVNVATKAIEGSEVEVKEKPSPTPSSGSNKSASRDTRIESLYRPVPHSHPLDRPADPPSASNPPVWRSVVANPQQRIQELEIKLKQIQEELEKERQEHAATQSEVQRLRTENERLQEESQTAAAQLRRFTEWFFTTIDRQ